jgi:CheY-like chemotaxis protein
MGHEVIVAGDGPEAVEILSSGRRIDLLISDIGLPGVSGRQVADAGHHHWPAMKVLFITGYGESQRDAANVPPDADIIRKPFDPNSLAQKVNEILLRG